VLAVISGIGTDIVKVGRFENISEGFKARCYTEGEREYLRGKPAVTAAGLFAAKEAVVKALGSGFKGFWPADVEIMHDMDGKPEAVLHGKAALLAKERGIGRIWISISHSETDAVAFAVAEKDDKL
jgi:holo-[acyl-carrier protein] synthase